MLKFSFIITAIITALIFSTFALNGNVLSEYNPNKSELSENIDEELSGTEDVIIDNEQNLKDLETLRPNLDGTATVKSNGTIEVTNVLDPLVLVNKSRNLPADYIPPDLVVPNVPFSFDEDLPQKQIREEAAKALEELFEKAYEEGMHIVAVSGYRSYDRQKAIFAYNAKNKGEEEANRTSAVPGQSEHQTGLAMDVSSANVGFSLTTAFGNTPEGKWLVENAPQFGYIIRYLEDKEDITGYSYEPWHLRYVGVEAAREISGAGITLEKYFQQE